MPKFLGPEDILKCNDLPTEVVEVPEWGADAVVKVRGLTGTERDRISNLPADADNFTARVVAPALLTEDGRQMFPDEDAVAKLGRKSFVALDRVRQVVFRLSGLLSTAVPEAKEQLVADPTADLPSD